MLTFATPGRPIDEVAHAHGGHRVGVGIADRRARAAREQRLGLIERERDVVLDVALACAASWWRAIVSLGVARRAPAEQHHDHAGGDHEQRQQDQDAGRRRERAPEARGRRRVGQAGPRLGRLHRTQCTLPA